MEQPSYAKDAFDVIEKLGRLIDVDAVMDAMHGSIRNYGFETAIASS